MDYHDFSTFIRSKDDLRFHLKVDSDYESESPYKFTVVINCDKSWIGTPRITLFMSEVKLINLMNSLIFEYERVRRENEWLDRE